MPRPRPEWMAVAAWEVRRIMGRKDYLFSVLLMPVLFVGVISVSSWFKQRADKKSTNIAVMTVEDSGALTPRVPPTVHGVRWVVPKDGERTRAALTAAVDRRALDGAALVPARFADADSVELLVRRAHPEWRGRVLEGLRNAARRERAAALNLDTLALARLDGPLAARESITSRGGRVSRGDILTAIAMMMLTVTTILTCGTYMGIGITGEKQARATEVILSAISAQSWIDGKIAAYAVIGLVQVVLWSAAGLLLAFMTTFAISTQLNPVTILGLILLFFCGLALYVALYALVFATVKDLQSTSKFQAYFFFMPFIPFLFMQAIIRQPDAAWVVVLSHVPFFAPITIPVRLALGALAPWELPVAVTLCAISFWLLRQAAGHAMRIGMLMYGKEVSLPELVRWAKEK